MAQLGLLLCAGAQVILMAGLQGVGKTTACGKLALALQRRNKRVLMVATDVYRCVHTPFPRGAVGLKLSLCTFVEN